MTVERLACQMTHLGRAIERFPDAPWSDALSHGQLQSKAWAVTELAKLRNDLGIVYVLGGWLGTLAPLLFAAPNLQINKLRSFDIDPTCCAVADQLNIDHVIDDWHYKAVTMDMFQIDYYEHRYRIPGDSGIAQVAERPDTIINTCCDHLDKFTMWWDLIPPGKLVLLQNNDFKDGVDHVNTVSSVADLVQQAPMTQVLFAGEHSFATVPYHRFMTIGIK